MKRFLEPPFWSCKDYIYKPRTVLFSPPFPKELCGLPNKDWHIYPSMLESFTSPPLWKRREKASLEGPGATPRLPQERGICDRKDREDWEIHPVIHWAGPQKGVKRRDPHLFGSSCWGPVSSGALGTHQWVILARGPQLLPQLPACSQKVWGERKEEKTIEEAIEEAVPDGCTSPK